MDVPRRAVLKAGAWSAPLIASAIAIPASITSPPTGTPGTLLSAAFPGAVTQTGTQWVDFEVTNSSLTDAVRPSWQAEVFADGLITDVTVPAGWTATLSGGAATVAGGIFAAGTTVVFRIQINVQPAPTGEVMAANVLEDGSFRAHAGVSMSTGPSKRPAVTRSYGPNGTHWPAHTPWIGDAAAKIVVVDCTWKAIETAIKAVTDAEAAAGVHIKVRPGSLPGNGVSTGSTPVMQTGIGKETWEKNVLVSPRDGWGTVKVTANSGARIRQMYGVTFARIDATAILLTNCTRSAWAQSKMSVGLRMTSSYVSVTHHCDAYEVVTADARVGITDSFGYAAGVLCTLRDSVWEGCYAAPVFRTAAAEDHVDTLQMYGNGWYRGLTVRDSTFFGSKNCALQIGGTLTTDPNRGTPFLTVDHSIVTSQATAVRVRYPVPAGAEAPNLDQAMNGTGELGQLFAIDSLIFGTIYDSTWGSVSNTSVSVVSPRAAVNSGAWTYVADMNTWNAAKFDELTPRPTDAYLASIWS